MDKTSGCRKVVIKMLQYEDYHSKKTNHVVAVSIQICRLKLLHLVSFYSMFAHESSLYNILNILRAQ